MFNPRIVPAILLSASLSGWLCAAPIEKLAASADAIVIGTVDARVETAITTSFQLRVERTLTGTPPSVIMIEHAWAGNAFTSQAERIVYPSYGIWFLRKKSASGSSWDVLRAQGRGKNLFASLYYPLTASASASITAPADASSAVEPIIIGLIKSSGVGGGTSTFVLDALGTTDSLAIRAALRELISGSSSRSKAVGMTGLLVRGDDTAVAALETMWPTIANAPESADVIAALRNSFRSTTSVGVSSLSGLAQSATISATVQQAAVWALKSIHTQSALPILASLLGSNDRSLKLAGAMGIAAFVNGCPVQGPWNVASLAYLNNCTGSPWATADTKANFIFAASTPEDEAAHETYWKTWWVSNQALLAH